MCVIMHYGNPGTHCRQDSGFVFINSMVDGSNAPIQQLQSPFRGWQEPFLGSGTYESGQFLQRVMKIPIGFRSDFIYQFPCWVGCWATQDCDAKPYPGLNLPHQGWQCFFPPQTTNIEDVFPIENWWIFHVMLVFRRYVHPYLEKMNPFCLQQYCSTRVELEPPPVRAVSLSSMESFQVLSRQLKRWHLCERWFFSVEWSDWPAKN